MLERDPKRRRLTPFNAPFRSPLRRPSTPTSTTTSTSTATPSTPIAQPLAQSSLSSTSIPHSRTPRTFKSPIIRINDDSLPPEIKLLVQRKRQLQQQVKQERTALETAQQARKYEHQVCLLTSGS